MTDTTLNVTFASEDMKNKFEEEFKKFTSDTALMEKIDAVDSIEEIYEICKDKVQFSLDQYREIMKDMEAQIKSSFIDDQDEELTDDDLEEVVGGSWGSFWKSFGKAAAIVGIVAGVVALSVVTGGAAAAGIAAAGYAVAGAVGTAGAAAAVAGATTSIIATGVAGGIATGALSIATLAGYND